MIMLISLISLIYQADTVVVQAERTDGQATNVTLCKPLFREALEMSRETLGNRDPSTLFIINNLGALLKAKGDLAAAESLCREAMEGLRETLGDRHPSTLASISNLGGLLKAKARLRRR